MTDEINKPDENKLIAERRAKLDALREQGNAFPNDFRRNAIAEELHQTFHAHDKEALEQEKIEVSVSGRMMAKRVMGKASFIKLQDRSGQIQVRLERDRLPEGVYQAFKKWDVGDIVGAQGELFRTRRHATGSATSTSLSTRRAARLSASARRSSLTCVASSSRSISSRSRRR